MTNAHKETTVQTHLFDPAAQKKATNLSVNSDLLRQAKALHINLSQVLETQLVLLLRTQKRRQWQQENSDAIEAYNRRVEQQGVFSDGARSF
jgi:antitoxin CcdA